MRQRKKEWPVRLLLLLLSEEPSFSLPTTLLLEGVLPLLRGMLLLQLRGVLRVVLLGLCLLLLPLLLLLLLGVVQLLLRMW